MDYYESQSIVNSKEQPIVRGLVSVPLPVIQKTQPKVHAETNRQTSLAAAVKRLTEEVFPVFLWL